MSLALVFSAVGDCVESGNKDFHKIITLSTYGQNESGIFAFLGHSGWHLAASYLGILPLRFLLVCVVPSFPGYFLFLGPCFDCSQNLNFFITAVYQYWWCSKCFLGVLQFIGDGLDHFPVGFLDHYEAIPAAYVINCGHISLT